MKKKKNQPIFQPNLTNVLKIFHLFTLTSLKISKTVQYKANLCDFIFNSYTKNEIENCEINRVKKKMCTLKIVLSNDVFVDIFKFKRSSEQKQIF